MYHTVDTLEKLIHTRELQIKMLEESAKNVDDDQKLWDINHRCGQLSGEIRILKLQRDELVEKNKPFWKKLFKK